MNESFFDPSTLLISEPFDNQDFDSAAELRTIRRQGFHGSLRRNRKLWLPPSVETAALGVLRTREHEWTHYRQHISTTFGLFIHRLHAVREMAYLWFLAAQTKNGERLRRPDIIPTVQIALGRVQNEDATGPLNLWQGADVVLGCLWQKTVRFRELQGIMTMLGPVLRDVATFAPGLAADSVISLSSTGSPDSLTCDHRRATAEAVMEGFAKYREYQELTVHFEDRVDVLLHAGRVESPLEDALLRVEKATGLPYWNPVVGALLEAAISAFPIEIQDGTDWAWESIHPGARLEGALSNFSNASPPSVSGNFRDDLPVLFDVVLELLGDSSESYRERYELAGRALALSADSAIAKELAAFEAPGRDGVDLNRLYNANVLRRFAEAFQLRAECPWIFWNPQLALHRDVSAWNKVVTVTAPPLVLGSSDMTMPLAHFEDPFGDHPVIRVAHLIATGQVLILRDLQRSGTMRYSKAYLRMLKRNEELRWVSDRIIEATGELIGQELMSEIVGEGFSDE